MLLDETPIRLGLTYGRFLSGLHRFGVFGTYRQLLDGHLIGLAIGFAPVGA